jgi:hypothetical protein
MSEKIELVPEVVEDVPKVGVKSKVVPVAAKPLVLEYKLNIYRTNGLLRSDINSAVYTDIVRKWGDILQSISSNKFVVIDEICTAVWERENRSYRRGHDRTRVQIEECVNELVVTGLVSVKK